MRRRRDGDDEEEDHVIWVGRGRGIGSRDRRRKRRWWRRSKEGGGESRDRWPLNPSCRNGGTHRLIIGSGEVMEWEFLFLNG